MDFRFLRAFFKQIATIQRGIFLIVIAFSSATAQPNTSGYTDVARQRLLIRITAQYVHTVSQGQIDMDSAIRIPCKVYGLSLLLAYNEGYSDGKPTEGSSLIDAGKVKDAKVLLKNVGSDSRLRLLIELGTYYVFKPGEAKADLDEATKYINEALQLSKTGQARWEIESLTLQGHLLQQYGRPDESRKVFAEVLTLCEQSGNRLAVARAAMNSAELLPYGDTARLVTFEKALAIFRGQKAKEKEIEALSQINISYFVTKRYAVAERLLRNILQLQAAIKFRHQQYPYDALAWLNSRSGDLTAALSYSFKSLECVKSKGDSVFINTFYTRRGILFSYLLKTEEALSWFNKGLANKSAENRLYWYRSFIGKVSALNTLGKADKALALFKELGTKYPPASYFEKMHFAFLLGETYENLKQYDLAQKNYSTFLAMAEKFPLEYVHGEFPGAFFQISGFFRQIGDLGKAKEYLERGRGLMSGFDIDMQGRYYYYLYKIDSIEKRYPDALKHLELSHVYSDSSFSFSQRKKTTELLVKYEAEKKDRDIKLLNSENQLARVRAQESERKKNITLAGIFLLLIIVALIFNRYRMKQRSNIQLEANQKELDQKNVFLERLNTEQEKLLKEKEWLIKEVHHRVKNNLQMVTSLLYSQSVYLEDDTAKRAVKDSLRRMQAMSLIHQKLYEDENTSTIAMPEYINDLVRYLHQSFDTDNRISFEQNIDKLDLDISQAIPLGLIITESIVNAIKYAFLNGQKGVVNIDLRQDGADHLLLKVSDNGIGLPTPPDKMERNSLGLDLMQGLARQLNGNFKIENNKGVHITIRFTVIIKQSS